jgi:hypothetical protein|tara:strand:- start:282 stop:458 length:177 start_codon:yes stop_codon:yes gene_type:complete
MPGAKIIPKHRQKKKKDSMTKKDNIANIKKQKKKDELPIGLRLPKGYKNIIDHGPEYA